MQTNKYQSTDSKSVTQEKKTKHMATVQQLHRFERQRQVVKIAKLAQMVMTRGARHSGRIC